MREARKEYQELAKNEVFKKAQTALFGHVMSLSREASCE
jgi:hypothetical protein